MASSGGHTHLVPRLTLAVLLLLSLTSPATAEDECVDYFKMTVGKPSGFGENVQVDYNFDETTAVTDDPVYVLSWTHGGTPASLPENQTFKDHFRVEQNGAEWRVFLKKSLINLPDYPTPTNAIQDMVTFTGFTGPLATCNVELNHLITDDNTCTPTADAAEYSPSIREDIPVGVTINSLTMKVTDEDYTPTFHTFTVSVDGNCPLEATEAQYSAGKNPADVRYKLKTELDYEDSVQHTCTVTFTDSNDAILTSSAQVDISVEDIADEPPVFDHTFYYTEVTETVPSDGPLDIKPAKIAAIDGDFTLNTAITYRMEDARPEILGTTYFEMHPSSADVKIIKELDNPILVYESLSFIITAMDASRATSKATLNVKLPMKACDGLHFEKFQYVTEVIAPGPEQEVLRVKATTGGTDSGVVEYSFNNTQHPYFTIDASSGWISTRTADALPPPGDYTLQVTATVPGAAEEAHATVKIYVLEKTGDLVITNSVMKATISELNSNADLVSVAVSGPVVSICVVGANPADMKDKFKVVENEAEWVVKNTGSLDYEAAAEITLTLEAYDSVVDCSALGDTTSPNLKRNQALVIIEVTDENDVAPTFIFPSKNATVVAYPTNPGLQKVVGPVLTVQATDRDTVGEVTYQLGGSNAAMFSIEESTGAVYPTDEFDCADECWVTAKVSDGVNEATTNIKVIQLDMAHVYTLTLTELSMSAVDEKLETLSEQAGIQISKLYASPQQSAAKKGKARGKRATSWTVEAHVYSVGKGNLASLEELNTALAATDSGLKAEKFTDDTVFNPGDGGVGMTVAVGVLGGLLGLVLLGGIGFFVFKKTRGGRARRPRSPINTLGQAYPNLSYEEEKQGRTTEGSEGHNTSKSLNGGFTSAEVHRSTGHDSPPLFRSGFSSASPKGLKRTNPGSPEYYGSSSPSPPPTFDHTTASTSSSPYYASPIHSEVTKRKDPDPITITAVGSSSSSSAYKSSSQHSHADKSFPLTVFSNSSGGTKQPAEPDRDYDNVATTKFSGLKGSPPPRRTHYDDDDDDIKASGVAYPGGKSGGHKEEGYSTEDEKKSVAFKVMVDTKEIEAQNKGPSQKKKEAEEILKENRKKIQEADHSDSDGEEGSVKL